MYLFTRAGLSFLLVLSAARLAADTIVSQNLQWTLAAGVNTAEVTNSGIHIAQKVGKDTKDYALLVTPVDLGSYGDWTFSCDLRLGKRESAGSYVTLKAGNNSVMLAGGDMWDKQGPLVVLGGRQVLSLTRDNEWHHIDVRYDLGIVKATVDGVSVGEASVPHAPDSIEVGTRNPNSGQQTEIFVRDITITKNHKLETSVPTPSPSDPSSTVQPSSKPSAGRTLPIKTLEPRTLATQSKGFVSVTSDSAIKLCTLSVRYVDTYAAEQVRGMKCNWQGAWIISAELVNDSDKSITIVPGVLSFDNRAFEGLYIQDGWEHGYQDNVVSEGPTQRVITSTATFYCPLAGKGQLKCLEQGKRTTINMYAENAGAWNVTLSRERKPVSASLLCVQNVLGAQQELDGVYGTDRMESILFHHSLGLRVFYRAMDALRASLKPPPPKDPLWVNIPINKETLTVGTRNTPYHGN